ncbi:hypothetical protein Tco_1166595 [Tanacetum coccineum]
MEESSKKDKSEITQESNSKRAREEMVHESSKKQKVDEDKESEELKKYLEIVPDDGDDVTIEVTPYLSNLQPLLTTRSTKKGRKAFSKLSEQMHHVEDSIWKEQQGLVKVLSWKLFDSCGAHCVTMQSLPYYLLVEKMYLLTNHTLYQLFNDVKLQVDYEYEMAYELLRLVKKQLKEGYGMIVGIKRLHDDLKVSTTKVRVTAVKQNLLMLLVYKLLLLVFRVNAAKLQLMKRLRLLKDNNREDIKDLSKKR